MNRQTGKWIIGGLAVLLLALLCAGAMADVAVNETNFPDPVFRQYVTEHFLSDPPYLSRSDIAKAKTIELYEKGVTSLKGLEYFTALDRLEVSGNKLKELDLTHNAALTYLSCDRNELSSLDLSKNEKLEVLSCFGNQITQLDISACRLMRDIICSNNGMKTLTLGKNTNLIQILCFDNEITSLNLKECKALKELICYGNRITELDLSGATGLVEMNCGENLLKKLDVSPCKQLLYLWCYDNSLTSLDVTKNAALRGLQVDDNQITSLDLSQNPDLKYLICYRTPITTLDLSKCATLSQLVLGGQPIVGDNYLEWGNPSSTYGEALLCGNRLKLITSEGRYLRITLDQESATLQRTKKFLKPTLQLTATTVPLSSDDTLVWASSNPKVATVDQNGLIQAVSEGKATITYGTADGSITAACRMTVADKKVTKITLSQTKAKLKVGEKLKLKAKIKPSDAVNQKVKWTSSNKKVAKVDKNGKVTAVGKGTCVIACVAQDGSKVKATCKISVKRK